MVVTKKETILVVGGAGYIGSHVCKAIHENGGRPIVFDNLSTGHRHAVRWGDLMEGDIRDADALDKAFQTYKPTVVIHLASCIEVGEGEVNPEKFYDVNVIGSLSLLNSMRRNKINQIIFSSTCATYGDTQNLPLRETEPQVPVSVYGQTKHFVENLLRSYAKAYGLQYAILRYFNASGADADGNIGEEHNPETHLIPNALKAAAKIGGTMKLFGDDYDTPDGTCVRDYIHVTDLADAHLLSKEALKKGIETLEVNVGTGIGISVLELLNTIKYVTGHEVPYDIAPKRSGDVAKLYADVSKAEEILGFKAKHSSIENIIRTAWNFHQYKS
ncbi:UDP-glucose 4-epimerase GalE [Hellea sp.]|nr:UDP-glucose 4-epimerase GalE [Hellea sp.]MDC1088160.1 UDP-glucose 4-epimerase GalE [Hellea sp.]